MELPTEITTVLVFNRASLTSVLGSKVLRTSLIEYSEGGGPFGGTPVIVRFERQQLELWTIYLQEMALSWNSIDVSAPPFAWFDEPPNFPGSRWLHSPVPLNRLVGQRVSRLRLLQWEEYCCGLQIVAGTSAVLIANIADDLLLLEGEEPLPPDWGFTEADWHDI